MQGTVRVQQGAVTLMQDTVRVQQDALALQQNPKKSLQTQADSFFYSPPTEGWPPINRGAGWLFLHQRFLTACRRIEMTNSPEISLPHERDSK